MAAANENMGGGLTVPELVRSLKTAVEEAEALLTREDKLQREIEAKKDEIESLRTKFEIEKLGLEKECEELNELARRLREERDKLFNRLKEKEDDQREIIKLKRKNCELECEKLKAKTDAEVYRKRFKELEGRLLIKSLEKEVSENLITTEAISGERVWDEDFVANGDASDGSEDKVWDYNSDVSSSDWKAKRLKADLEVFTNDNESK